MVTEGNVFKPDASIILLEMSVERSSSLALMEESEVPCRERMDPALAEWLKSRAAAPPPFFRALRRRRLMPAAVMPMLAKKDPEGADSKFKLNPKYNPSIMRPLRRSTGYLATRHTSPALNLSLFLSYILQTAILLLEKTTGPDLGS